MGKLRAQKSKNADLATLPAYITALSGILQTGLLFENSARRIIFANETFRAIFGVAGPARPSAWIADTPPSWCKPSV